MAHKKGRQCKEWTRFEQQTSWCKNFLVDSLRLPETLFYAREEQFIILAKNVGTGKDFYFVCIIRWLSRVQERKK